MLLPAACVASGIQRCAARKDTHPGLRQGGGMAFGGAHLN
jgi:hypothetical protein